MDIKNLLMTIARTKGICLDGYRTMRTSTTDALVAYYLAHPDWCIERNFPPLPILKSRFCGFEDKGVYVGKAFDGEVLNDLQVYVFHNCKGTIRTGLNVDKAIIPMMYFANDCEMLIEGIGEFRLNKPTAVPLYIFGSNAITANDNDFVRFKKFSQTT